MLHRKQNLALEVRQIAELQKTIRFLFNNKDKMGAESLMQLETAADAFSSLVSDVNWDTVAVELEREEN